MTQCKDLRRHARTKFARDRQTEQRTNLSVRLHTETMICIVLYFQPEFPERAAIFDHIVRGVLSPHPTSIRSLGPCPSARFGCCARQHPGHGSHFGYPMKQRMPGLQRRPKAKPPRPTYSIFRSDCHLPAMESADRRLRP